MSVHFREVKSVETDSNIALVTENHLSFHWRDTRV